MGISLILGGSEPLPGWFGALMQWKLKLKWAFACVKEGVKACEDAFCTYDLLKSAPKKSAPAPAPAQPTSFEMGLPRLTQQ